MISPDRWLRLPRRPRPGILRPLMRRLSVLVAALAFSLLACKSPCRQLSEKLCECARTTAERQQCLTAASAADQRVTPTDDENRYCAQLLPRCDCTQLQSADTVTRARAKEACGLAVELPASVADAGQ